MSSVQPHKRKSAGFSLVETLVAITILLIAVLAPIHIVNQSIKASIASREQLTATFLAQEGAEAIVRFRENDALDGGSTWNLVEQEVSGGILIDECLNLAEGCDYDFATDALVSCSVASNCLLYFDAAATNGYYYSHDGTGVATPYTRVITVNSIPLVEAEVTSTVSWNSAVTGRTESVEVKTRVFDKYAPN